MSANTTRKVRFGDDQSSRASTVGGSSTSSSHSGSSYPDQYTDRYNIAALQDTLAKTVQQLDAWRDEAHKYKEEASSAKARVSALENSVVNLKNDKKDSEQQVKELKQQLKSLQEDHDKLKKKNESLKKKLRDQDSQSEGPSSPDSAKLRRSGSKKSKQPDADDIDKDRLKERFDRSSATSSTTSGSTHSKPPSSSKTPASRHRRASMSSSGTERPALYVENYGPSAPRAMPPSPAVPNSSRRASHYPPGADYHISPPIQEPVYPRNIGMQRGSVEVPLYEDGNYHFHPLPDQRRPY